MTDPFRTLARLRVARDRLEHLTRPFLDRFADLDESTLLLGFAAAIGIAVGVAVILFYKLIDVSQQVALSAAGSLAGLERLSVVLVVLVGITLAAVLVVYLAKDEDGGNVPDVMRAVAKRGGIIPLWPVTVKTVSAGVLIGSAGSVGAEGPVAVAGSALGSRLGQTFRFGSQRLKVLVACGAAAGISAAFNAPIAGVFFSLEKILGTFGTQAFPPVLVASVVSAAISRAAFGSSPVIAIPTEYGMGSPSELVLYALLGIVTGVVAVLYTRGVYRAGDLLGALRRRWLQVVAAGLIVGILDVVFLADLWGRGHQSLSLQIIGQREAHILVALAFAKLVVTAVTVAATKAGGVFTPALFIGATLGGGLAVAAGALLPHWNIVPEAFALAGMAGLVAGATHAPLTAIMIVFEMSGDYALILPIMLCVAIAYITARQLHPYSIYSEWLVRRGERIDFGRDVTVLERLTVGQAYDDQPEVIAEDAGVDEILQTISASTQPEFPVVDRDGRLRGMITYNDIRQVLGQRDTLASVLVAADIAHDEAERVTPDDTLRAALKRIGLHGTHSIPVVDGTDNRLLGLISRQHIFAAYDRDLLRTEDGATGAA